MSSKEAFLFFIISAFVPYCSAVCYFPDYLQGEFSMQSPTSQMGQIKYTPVSITSEAVSLWGFCNKKIGNGLYLIDRYDSFNETYCLRCFHISVKSQNVVVIRLAGHTDRCFVSSQAAESSCPKLDQLDSTRQIILFKTKEDIRKEYCPINGRYTIHYKQNKPDYAIECSTRSSQLDNCPVGSEMNIRFRDCHFENHDLVFECLGSWDGPNQQRYLALFDTRTGTDPRPQYRCGLYKEDPGSGTVYVAFSSDSTCITDLMDAQSGFETLVLTKLIPNFPPQIHDTSCRFPSWTEGRWELVTVRGNIFTYTDLTYFKNYTFQCLEEVHQRYSNFPASPDDKYILVHGKTQCDEEMYTCIWLKKRGDNVFEFQLATQASQYPNNSLCSPQNFQTSVWITQGRKDLSTVSPCPILGEYIGMLPNAENLCAKLSSDCISQDTMYYMVSDCSQQQIYEGAHSGPKYRKSRQANADEITEKNINETSSTTSSIKNDTIANITTTTPIPTLSTTAITVMTNDSQINQTIVSATTVETTTKVITTTADLRSEPSQRVIYNDNYQTSSEISVGSYYAENKNFGDFSRDIRLLPAPISSSTVSPYVPYRRNYVPPAPASPNYPYTYDQPRYPDYTNYRDDRRHRNDYYQQRTDYNRNYPSWNQSQVQMPQSNQMYVMDPMSTYRQAERKTVIALPPVQLPPMPPTYRPMYSSRRQNFVHLFKEREYRCLGQWQENNLTYTFTQRKDIGTYECFVGSMISEYEISVREAGKHCERNMNSLMLEMKLSLKSSCAENRSSTTVGFNTPTTQTTPVTVTTTKSTVNKRILQHTTRPWRPLNNMTRPQSPFRNKNASTGGCTNKVPSHLILLSVLNVIIYKILNFAFTNL